MTGFADTPRAKGKVNARGFGDKAFGTSVLKGMRGGKRVKSGVRRRGSPDSGGVDQDDLRRGGRKEKERREGEREIEKKRVRNPGLMAEQRQPETEM